MQAARAAGLAGMPLFGHYIRMKAHRQAAQFGMVFAPRSWSRRDEQHGIKAHFLFSQGQGKEMVVVFLAQGREAHKAARDRSGNCQLRAARRRWREE